MMNSRALATPQMSKPKNAVADDLVSQDRPVDQPIMIARLMDDLRHDPVLPPPVEDMQVALTLWGNRAWRVPCMNRRVSAMLAHNFFSLSPWIF